MRSITTGPTGPSSSQSDEINPIHNLSEAKSLFFSYIQGPEGPDPLRAVRQDATTIKKKIARRPDHITTIDEERPPQAFGSQSAARLSCGYVDGSNRYPEKKVLRGPFCNMPKTKIVSRQHLPTRGLSRHKYIKMTYT